MASIPMTICLWYDTHAEQAVNFYTSIFKDSEIGAISRYGKEGFEFHGRPEGSVMTINFKLNGMNFTALNGGPIFEFNESMSIMVSCKNQEEIDYYWTELTKGGKESQCGWLKDKFGVSWQIVPANMDIILSDTDTERVQRVTREVFKMRKLDMNKLTEVYNA